MLRLGILGTGKIVQEFLPHLAELDFEAVSILSTPRSVERAERLAAQYHIGRCVTDYDEMLQSEVDVIYVALPNHLHFSFAGRALEHGKHVICEKPMTSNVDELRTLIDVAKKNRVMLLEAMTLYHLPAYQAMRRDLAKLGPIKIVSLNYSQYSSRYDAFLQGIVQPAFDPAQSGGALMDINVYNIHALVGLFGKPAAVQYAANIARGIDTSGIALCRYPTFQAVCVGAKDCASRQTSVIEGERGVLSIEGPVSCMTGYTIDYHDGKREVRVEDNPPYRMVPEFQAFVRILNEQDWACHDTLMEYSLEAAQILEDARRCAGVRFPCDAF